MATFKMPNSRLQIGNLQTNDDTTQAQSTTNFAVYDFYQCLCFHLQKKKKQQRIQMELPFDYNFINNHTCNALFPQCHQILQHHEPHLDLMLWPAVVLDSFKLYRCT